MSTLAADVSFDFTFPPCDPATPPGFAFDPSLLEIPYHPGHARSSSHGSVYSVDSSPSDAVSTRRTTPARSPVRTHGPLLLPRIRSQDQALNPSAAPGGPPAKRRRTSPAPASSRVNKSSAYRRHARSFTNPEVLGRYSPPAGFCSQPPDDSAAALLCSPVSFAPVQDFPDAQPRRASSCSLDSVTIERYGFPTYRQVPASAAPQMQACLSEPFMYQPPQPYAPRAPSPLAAAPALTPEPTPTTTLLSYLTTPNPAPSLVRTISFPLRDPHTRHFWWDVRQVRQWTGFNTSAILSLPGAPGLLSYPVPAPLLPHPAAAPRHPETESALHAIYAGHYLPKLNAALAVSSTRPIQLSVPARAGSHLSPAAPPSAGGGGAGQAPDCAFVANVAGEPATAAAIFGGKPTARVVGLVKSFDRFNTGMRAEGNVKRVEYLRGLAHLHHVMREHSCRYGFILTEIELVVVRNGAEGTPHFGYLEVQAVQLNASGGGGGGGGGGGDDDDAGPSPALAVQEMPLTACLALWGLCMMASDEAAAAAQAQAQFPGHFGGAGAPAAHPPWRAEIGAPAEGTRRKALPRDDWMPQPQLAEKREAKRARGWVWPEDPVGRKELGKRGVRYGAC